MPGTGSHGFKVKGQLRFFGHNLPDSFPLYIANPAIPAVQRWVTRTAGVHYFVDLAAGLTRYALDTKVDSSIKPGALVVADRGAEVSPRYAFALVAAVEANKNVVGPAGRHRHLAASAAGRCGRGHAPGRRRPSRDRRRPQDAPVRTGPPGHSAPHLRLSRQPDRRHSLHSPGPPGRRHPSGQEAADRHFDGANPALAAITSVTVLPPGSDGIGHIQIGFTPSIGAALPNARMNANVAPASHGETQPDESIGHGDSAKLFQRFKLQRKPVTRLPGGAGVDPETELSVRVNGELWDEAAVTLRPWPE